MFYGIRKSVGGFFVPCGSVIYGMLEVVVSAGCGEITSRLVCQLVGVRGSCSTVERVESYPPWFGLDVFDHVGRYVAWYW